LNAVPPTALMSGESCQIDFRLALTPKIHAPHLRLTFYTEGGEPLCSFGTHLTRTEIPRRDGLLDVQFEVENLPLNLGSYWANIALCDGEQGDVVIHRVERAFSLRVEGGDPQGTGRLPEVGSFVFRHRWNIVGTHANNE
jgi:hypothetical protein